MAEPSETGHHLVRDIEDVIVAADLADALEITIRRHDDTARCLHRLADESADLLRPDASDRIAELIYEEIGEGGDINTFRPPERIGRGQLHDKVIGAVHPVA